MEKFGDYILQKKINKTKTSITYRGHKENESQSFIIKLQKEYINKKTGSEERNWSRWKSNR